MTTKFKDVVGYEGFYFVSEKGKIKSTERKGTIKGFLSPGVTKQGYRRVSLLKGGRRKSIFVHVLVAKAWIPNPLNRPFVNHKDGNKLNNHASNLEWVTASENCQHAYNNGLRKAHPTIGEKHPSSKLKEQQVVAILKSNLSQQKLSKFYKVSAGVIQRIKQRKSWKHVQI